MSPATIFELQMLLGYVPWLLCVGVYGLPWLKSMERAEAHRLIATLHSFRFFGLVFILPGVVGPNLPSEFAVLAAYGDLATGIIAMLALASFRIRPLFWTLIVAFNVVGAGDILLDYLHGVQFGLPELSGQLGAGYAIVAVYVPLLMITHGVALYLLLRRQPATAGTLTGATAAA
jgi:hypothetical protein